MRKSEQIVFFREFSIKIMITIKVGIYRTTDWGKILFIFMLYFCYTTALKLYYLITFMCNRKTMRKRYSKEKCTFDMQIAQYA